ncbi:MAG: hypothetical protein PF795_03085 [Kiritimatiellae bacterium]|jgi:hypothetical protein|nr:hypothetical protein [Kiritimatiellia bacterium]
MKTYFLITILVGQCLAAVAVAESLDRYDQLVTAYRDAIGRTREESNTHRTQLFSRCTEALEQMATTFKDSGNLGFHLEARTFAKKLQDEAYDEVEVNRFMSTELQNFYSKLVTALENIDQQERLKRYQMQKVMIDQLETITGDLTRAGKIDLAVKADEHKQQILTDPDFVQLREAERQAAAYTPPPAPAPASSLPATGGAQQALANLPPMLEVDLFRRGKAKLAQNGDYDDQLQEISLTVKIRSRELVKDYGRLKIKIWAIGRGNSSSAYKMILVDTVELKELPKGQTEKVDTKSVQNLYDHNYSAQYGYKYYGYVCEIIEPDSGEVLFEKTMPSRFERKSDTLKQKSEGEEFSL